MRLSNFRMTFWCFWLQLCASLVALGSSSVYLRINENVTLLTFQDDFFDVWLCSRVPLAALGGSLVFVC